MEGIFALLLLLPAFTFASRPVSFPGALQIQHEGEREKIDLTNLKLAPANPTVVVVKI